MDHSTQSSNQLPGHSLDPKTMHMYQSLCEVLPREQILELKQQAAHYFTQVQANLKQNEFIDIATAQQLTETVQSLLDAYETFTDSQKSAVVGAARYFIKDDDAEHDTDSILGLDDDVAVLNYVLDLVGRPEQKIQL